MQTSTNKTTAILLHLSVLLQYAFPLGNFIFPLVIWSVAKRDSGFIDRHGRSVINFQISLFLYTVVLALIAIPIFAFTIFKNIPLDAIGSGHWHIDGPAMADISGVAFIAIVCLVLYGFLKIAEVLLVILGAVKASDGAEFRYPITINFLSMPEEKAEGGVSSSTI